MEQILKKINQYPKKNINKCIKLQKPLIDNILTNDEPKKSYGINEEILGTRIGEIESEQRPKMTIKEIERLRKTQIINVDTKYDQRKLALYNIFNQIMKAFRHESTRNLFEDTYKMYIAIEDNRRARYNNPNKTMVLAWCVYYIYLQYHGSLKISQSDLLEKMSNHFSEINIKTLNTSKNEVSKILNNVDDYSELIDQENEIIQSTLKCDFDKKLKSTNIMEQIEFIIKMIENYDDTINNYVNKYRPTVEIAVLSFLARSSNIDKELMKYRDKTTALSLCNVSLVNSKIFKEVIDILTNIFEKM
jgi:hypothetical protein